MVDSSKKFESSYFSKIKVNHCLLCGEDGTDPVCATCHPKIVGSDVCMLCRVTFKDVDDRFCNDCRLELGTDSDADGARFVRSFLSRAKFCEPNRHLLGVIPCYCLVCDDLQPNWQVCELCTTLQGEFHLCMCGLVGSKISATEVSPELRTLPYLQKQAVLRNDGNPIDADEDEELWLELRQTSMGASDAMKLLKMNGEKRKGFEQLLEHKRNGAPEQEFWAFEHGVEREPHIARWIQINLPNFRLCYNRFVYAGEDLRHLATPDMVGPFALAEIKTSTKTLEQARTRYYDQLQWQMHVTRYQYVLFVVENRYSGAIEHELIERDQRRIDLLIEAANELLDQLCD